MSLFRLPYAGLFLPCLQGLNNSFPNGLNNRLKKCSILLTGLKQIFSIYSEIKQLSKKKNASKKKKKKKKKT